MRPQTPVFSSGVRKIAGKSALVYRQWRRLPERLTQNMALDALLDRADVGEFKTEHEIEEEVGR
jgi:hypothetical protein